MNLTEFILQFKSNKDFINDPLKFLKKDFFPFLNNEPIETVKFFQISSVLSVTNIFIDIYNTKIENGDIHKTISIVVAKLIKEGLSPLTFSYFISLVLHFFDFQPEYMDWINPFKYQQHEKNTELTYRDFGFGSNIETIEYYDIDNTTIHGLKTELKILYLPNSITKIGEHAFEGQNFKIVMIPSSVKTIEKYAFKNCKNLQAVIFEEPINELKDGLFEGCESLNYLSTLQELDTIGDSSLYNTGIELIDERLFKNSVVLSDVVNQVKHCRMLILHKETTLSSISNGLTIQTLTLSDSIKSLSTNCLNGFKIETLRILAENVEIKPSSLQNTSISYIECFDSRYSISENYFFHIDKQLLFVLDNEQHELKLPNNITQIKTGAFNHLNSLQKLVLHEEIQLVEKQAIFACENFNHLVILGQDISCIDKNFFDKRNIHTLELIQQIDTPINASFPNIRNIKLHKNFEHVLPFQFATLKHLEFINLNMVKSIDDYAFNECISLKSVDLQTVEFIGFGAFSKCMGLETMIFNIPNNNGVKIYPKTFGSLFDIDNDSKNVPLKQHTPTGVKTYYIPSSLESLTISGSFIPFGYFSGLNFIFLNFENNIKTIESYGLYDTSIETIKLEDESIICEYGLSELKQLKYIENLTLAAKIEKNNFNNCIQLEELIISANEFEISTETLSSLKSLNKIEISSFKNKNWIVDNNLLFDMDENRLLFFPPLYNPTKLSLTKLKTIHKSIFKWFDNLIDLTISNAEIIEDEAFAELRFLQKLSIDSMALKIGENILKNCQELQELSLPFIGSNKDESFEGNFVNYYSKNNLNQLKILKIEDGFIKDISFNDLTNLISFTYSGADTSLTDNAFKGLNKLLDIDFGSGLTSIGDYCFALCENLLFETKRYPLKYIGKYAFHSCQSIDSIELNDSIEYIGEYAFDSCRGVNRISLTTQANIGKSAFQTNSIVETLKIYLPVGNMSNYFGDDYMIKQAFITTDSMMTNFMANNKTIEDVVLDGKLEKIPNNAFSNCKALTQISLNNNVTVIGAQAFKDSDNLNQIHGLDSVRVVQKNAFSGCLSLHSLSLGSVELIENNSFIDCTALKAINVSTSLKKIGSNAFSNCLELESLSNTDNVLEVGEEAFKECHALSEISLPKLTMIREKTFENCHALNGFNVSNSCKIIETAAFKSCSNLTKVVIPMSVNYIASFAFENSNTNLILALTKKRQVKTYHKYWNYKTKNIESATSIIQKLKLKINDTFTITKLT